MLVDEMVASMVVDWVDPKASKDEKMAAWMAASLVVAKAVEIKGMGWGY